MCSSDLETILGLRYLGLQKREGGWVAGGQQISWRLTAQAQEKAAHGHVAYAVQEVSKTASKEAQNGTLCPGNERWPVEILCGHFSGH